MSQANLSPSIACLLISHLPVKAERCRYPALRGRPLVIVEQHGDRDRVLDSSPEASGVVPGMSLPEALDRCSSAMVMQADPAHYGDVDDGIAGAVRSRFGIAERDGPGRIYASLEASPDGGGLPLFGEAQLITSLLQVAPLGFTPTVGVAPGRFAAYAVAAAAREGTAARAPADVTAFLRACSIDLLPLSPEQKQRLRGNGFTRLGALSDSPFSQIQAILGADARRAVDLARGIDRTLRPGASLAAA